MVDFYLSQLEISQFFEFFGKIIAPFQGSVTDKFPGNIIGNSFQDGPKIFFSKSDKEIFYKGQFGELPQSGLTLILVITIGLFGLCLLQFIQKM